MTKEKELTGELPVALFPLQQSQCFSCACFRSATRTGHQVGCKPEGADKLLIRGTRTCGCPDHVVKIPFIRTEDGRTKPVGMYAPLETGLPRRETAE